MTHYVLCIVHTTANAYILVKKARPHWQRGLLNFPGGRMERGESPRDAATREFQEEVGLTLEPDEWRPVCELRGHDYQVFVLKYSKPVDLPDDVANESRDEPVVVLQYTSIALGVHRTVHNVPWLAAVSRDQDTPPFKVNYP